MKPTILIASPQMADPFFERTVVLLWHHDDEGAIGVVVNRHLDHAISEVISAEDGVQVIDHRHNRVSWGGPVETTSGTVVTSGSVEEAEGWTLECGINITRSQDALHRLLGAGEPVILCLGYAGWGPGQLDQEIQKGGWLYVDADPKLVFTEDPEHLYELALGALGLKEHQVWMQPIDE